MSSDFVGESSRCIVRRVQLLSVVMERPARPGERTIRGPEDAAAILRTFLPADREGFAVLFLNARACPIGAELVSVGSLNGAIVHPREVFKGAILASAAAIICGHNHPSGDPEPSAEDISITRRLAECGALLGIEVKDHIVIGAASVVSLRARGIL